MAVARTQDLTPAARQAAETYLAAVSAALRAADPAIADETLEDVRAHLLDSLDAQSSADDVAAVTAELGSPAEYGASPDDVRNAAEPAQPPAFGAGTLLGIPYDVRPPTSERVASRLWSPRDPRIFMPRIWGMGWTLNFGAIAVKLNLIEPDAEDEPFAEVPDGAFLLALLVPVGLTAAILGSYLALRASLPAELPAHWNAAGIPDDFWPAAWAFAVPFSMAFVPTAWAVWSVAAQRSRFYRGGAIAAASFLAAVAAGVWALTLLTVFDVVAGWWVPLVCIFAAFPVPLVILVGLSRAGRAAEQRRDLRS